MFKGLSGLKKVVKGGFSAVAEHTGQLADQVVGDPSNSPANIKEALKQKVSAVVGTAGDKTAFGSGSGSGVSGLGSGLGSGGGSVSAAALTASEGAAQAKDKVTEVAHNIKHYGALGEDYLGFSDPTKDLRKAVKQREKAAKKARKDKKKKTGKKDDLFDPENLAKYKQEIEERHKARLEAQALAEGQSDQEAPSGTSPGGGDSEEAEDEPAQEPPQGRQAGLLSLDLQPGFTSASASAAATPLRSPGLAKTPKEDTEDWQLFQRIAGGADNLIQSKKERLQELKETSYFQQKKAEPDQSEGQKVAGKVKVKKNWVDLNEAGFEDHDGSVSFEESPEAGGKEVDDHREGLAGAEDAGEVAEGSSQPEPEEDGPVGLVEVPEEDNDPDEDDDLFNTAFVDALTSGDLKLVVIPEDDKVDGEDDDDDPFNTKFAEDIVKKDKEVKRQEVNKLKFAGLSSVADVLAGKADKVDKDLIQATVKSKRRRANRINLIAEDQSEVTKVEDIAQVPSARSTKVTTADEVSKELLCLVGDLDSALEGPANILASTPSPIPPRGSSEQGQTGGQVDLSEFESWDGQGHQQQLTSNVAILAGEFSQPALEVEDDDFDAAFDAIAQESVTKAKLEELEKELGDDVFDTSCADRILSLASLANTNKRSDGTAGLGHGDVDDEDAFDEDKDPFDTSAFEDITGEFEAELGFECLASRAGAADGDSGQVVPTTTFVITGAEADPFLDTTKGSDAFGSVRSLDGGGGGGNQVWSAFKDELKPKRPPPPKPRTPPARPKQTLQYTLDPSQRPSVVVKAPSSESIKSWNCATADILIKKSEIEALENQGTLFEEDDGDDPFDTSAFAVVEEDQAPGRQGGAPLGTHGGPEHDDDDEDPFDTSAVPDFEEGIKADQEDPWDEEERVPDVIEAIDLLGGGDPEDLPQQQELRPAVVALVPVVAEEVDPFDTEFAANVLPNKGDPFDTSFVKGGLGKAELRALEEELIDTSSGCKDDDGDENQGRPKKGPRKRRPAEALGPSGRARPKPSQELELAEIRVGQPEEQVEEDEEDPFDTSAVVLPAAGRSSGGVPSGEDEAEDDDPFDTSAATAVIPELRAKALAEAKEKAEQERLDREERELLEAKVRAEEEARAIAERARTDRNKVLQDQQQQQQLVRPEVSSDSDDDFDPRA